MSTEHTFDVAVIESTITQRKVMPGALLTILHDTQNAVGYILPGMVSTIAERLNLPRRDLPGARLSMVGQATKLLGCDFHQMTDDDKFSLEVVYCLGQCASGPAVQIDDDLCNKSVKSVTIFVPRDATALALSVNQTAEGKTHSKALGLTEVIPYLKKQKVPAMHLRWYYRSGFAGRLSGA